MINLREFMLKRKETRIAIKDLHFQTVASLRIVLLLLLFPYEAICDGAKLMNNSYQYIVTG